MSQELTPEAITEIYSEVIEKLRAISGRNTLKDLELFEAIDSELDSCEDYEIGRAVKSAPEAMTLFIKRSIEGEDIPAISGEGFTLDYSDFIEWVRGDLIKLGAIDTETDFDRHVSDQEEALS
jgi:hypothetical protein